MSKSAAAIQVKRGIFLLLTILLKNTILSSPPSLGLPDPLTHIYTSIHLVENQNHITPVKHTLPTHITNRFITGTLDINKQIAAEIP